MNLKNNRNRFEVRRVWPDLDEDDRKFFTKDDLRFTVMLSLILIILFCVMLMIGYGIRIADLSEKIRDLESDACAPVFEDGVADRIDRISVMSVVKIDITPTATAGVVDRGEVMELPDPEVADGRFKTRLDYRMITDRSSYQYDLQQLSWTDSYGFRRYGLYYLIALGISYSNRIGQTFEITLSSGRVFDCMLGDVKRPEDTDRGCRFVPDNGNIVEFIVDRKIMDPAVYDCGNISALGFEGSVVQIVKTEFKGWRD